MERATLTDALTLLGEVLGARGLAFDLLVVGGGALLLHDLIRRATLDLDAVARKEGRAWVSAKPLPAPLVDAVRDVADTLGLPREPRDGKDWLNGGPTFLRKLGLPEGFVERATVRRFGALTVRVVARSDLVVLKLWAATDPSRGVRRAVDVRDLREVSPTLEELRRAAAWCAQRDGRSGFFWTDVAPVLEELGVDPKEIGDG